jgi:hypothetical protein
MALVQNTRFLCIMREGSVSGSKLHDINWKSPNSINKRRWLIKLSFKSSKKKEHTFHSHSKNFHLAIPGW